MCELEQLLQEFLCDSGCPLMVPSRCPGRGRAGGCCEEQPDLTDSQPGVDWAELRVGTLGGGALRVGHWLRF